MQRLILRSGLKHDLNLYGKHDPAQRIDSHLSDAQLEPRLGLRCNRRSHPIRGSAGASFRQDHGLCA